MNNDELKEIRKILHNFDIGKDSISECVKKIGEYIEKLLKDQSN